MRCSTVQVQDVPDSSSINVGDIATSSPGAGVVVVDYMVINQISSGDGQTITRDVVVTADGTEVDRRSVTLSPSQNTTRSIEVSSLTPGNSVEICVTVQ